MNFDAVPLLTRLAEHDVDFVLIGGVAARALGSTTITRDLDVCYDRARPNLERLAAMLRAVHARLRGVPEGLPFQLNAQTLYQGDSFTFETDFGPFDILATPSGTRGYPELAANAEVQDLGGGLLVRICTIEDLMRMKTAAGRLKDRVELEVLGALRDQREGHPEEPWEPRGASE